MDQTDEQLVQQIQAGDSDLFGEIVERYESKLSRYLSKFLYDSEDVTDILQDVFVKAFINIQSFDNTQRFSPWIYRIAHNEAINFLKKRKTISFSLFDVDILFPHPIADERADSESEFALHKKMLDECLDRIDIKYKEILLLYFYEDMSYKDISQILKIPISSVGVRINRAKKMVEKLVGPKYNS